MRIAVSGSIASDHLMTFPGRFGEQLLPDQLHHLSVSFLVDDLDIRRGGIAANICFGLGLLGLRPVLVGAVGDDFGEYGDWLDSHGVDTSGVLVSETRHTARFVCTTDADQNQIASFYSGAMSEAGDIDLDALGELDLMLISPNDPGAMLAHTEHCRSHGIRFAADPSQQLATLEGDAIRALLDGADLLFGNAYEAALLESKSGWTAAEVLSKVGTRVTTHGAEGIVIERGCRAGRLGRHRAGDDDPGPDRGRATPSGPASSPGSRGGCRWSARRRSARCSPRCAWRRSEPRSTSWIRPRRLPG